jgi:hypothetical protein
VTPELNRYDLIIYGEEMKIRYLISIALCSLSITACAPMQSKFQELQVPPERIFQRGYSLMPMNEAGWVIFKRDQDQVELAKVLKDSKEVWGIRAYPFRLPEFQSIEEIPRLKKEHIVEGMDPLDIKEVDVAAYSKKGVNCFKWYLEAIDNSPTISDKPGLMKVIGLMCLHPNKQDIGVEVLVQYSNHEGAGDSAFIEKATRVIDSVEFTDY